MIEVKNLTKYYNNNGVVTQALRNINLKLSKGEIVAIVGQSGSGKSTLLNVICGVDTYEDGEILFKGNETSYFNQNDMDIYRKKNVSFIYQNYNIIDSYTVLENVMLPLLINGSEYKTAKSRAIELIQKVGLQDRIKNKGTQLSGGEKQRCVIARALASDCEILACDEPTGNLDSKTGKEIIQLIKEVAKNKLVLIVTHNYEQVEDIVTRTIKVEDGEIVEDHSKVVIQEDIMDEMNLVEDKVRFKSLATIALKNTKSTPKKNVFSLLVMIIFSLIVLFLYLSCNQANDTAQYNMYQSYKNTVQNRVIVYSKDHRAIDESKFDSISGKKYMNAFYEDELFSLSLEDNVTISATVSNEFPKKLSNKKGEYPSKDSDMYIILPEGNQYTYEVLNKYLDKEVTLFLMEKTKLNLTGYALSSELTYPLCVTHKNYFSEVPVTLFTSMNKTVSLKVNNEVKEAINVLTSTTASKVEIDVYSSNKPSSVTDVCLSLNGIYQMNVSTEDIQVNWIESLREEIIIKFPKQYKIDTFEVTIYADDAAAVISRIKDMGYGYLQPSRAGAQNLSVNYILYVMLLIVSTIAIIVLAFVSYVILAKIYVSKNQDYTIMRSMGLIKRNMARIVNLEVIIICITAATISIIGLSIASIFNLAVKNLLSYNSFGFMIVYYLVILLSSLFISRRFNKRLFKFSVGTSIKGEVVRND